MTITSVLVANRGEIARRVFRTARTLGLSTVAVYSDPDAGSPHVTDADAAVRLPGSAAAETYLRADLLIEAARRAGADAVHPGYGFLSENGAFARAVQDAGLIWIGPTPDAIEVMGSKIESKRLMTAAGVPVLAELQPEDIAESDLPVLIKASAGGGGRGMRVVTHLADLPGEVEAARAEAASAFGDPTVFCEPYLATGRHIEVQILADTHGTIWTVGERECSIQRRHQKVAEETPSPLVERLPDMRERLFEASHAAAKAIGYTGAGTVEFLADDDGRFFFLEMNTRLQVEHPVTECTTGLDLVQLQFEVADGGRLAPEPPRPAGHAIEVRLYAEDASAKWQPQSGTLHRFHIPGTNAEFTTVPAVQGIRVDSGVADGSVVGIHYDPMLAKVIAWAPTREQAARSLAGALARSELHGVTTNRDLLVNILRHRAFLAGETDTAFLDRHGLDTLAASPLTEREVELTALAAALALDAAERADAPLLSRLPSGWRNVVSQPRLVELDSPTGRQQVSYRHSRTGLVTELPDVALIAATPASVVLDDAGVRRTFAVARYGSQLHVGTPAGSAHFTVVDPFPDPVDQVAAGSLVAAMPGSVVRVEVAVGDAVAAGQPLLWLEAMKMQHRIDSPAAGTVTELPVAVGDQVDLGAVLAVVTPEPAEPTGSTEED